MKTVCGKLFEDVITYTTVCNFTLVLLPVLEFFQDYIIFVLPTLNIDLHFYLFIYYAE